MTMKLSITLATIITVFNSLTQPEGQTTAFLHTPNAIRSKCSELNLNQGNWDYDRRFGGRGEDANRWSNSLNQGNSLAYYNNNNNRQYTYDNRWSNSIDPHRFENQNLRSSFHRNDILDDRRWSNSIDPHFGGMMSYGDRGYTNDNYYGNYPNEGFGNNYYGASNRWSNNMYPSYEYGGRNNYYEDNMRWSPNTAGPRNFNNYQGYGRSYHDVGPYYSSNVMRGSNSEDPYGNNRQE